MQNFFVHYTAMDQLKRLIGKGGDTFIRHVLKLLQTHPDLPHEQDKLISMIVAMMYLSYRDYSLFFSGLDQFVHCNRTFMVEFMLASLNAGNDSKDQRAAVYNFVGILLNSHRFHVLLQTMQQE